MTSLSRSTAVMAIGTMLSRITGFGRLVALGFVMDYRSGLPDAYNLANNAPNIVYELVLGGILSATLVPLFVKHFSTEDEEGAWRSISTVFTLTVAVSIVVSTALFLAAPLIIDLYTIGSTAADAGDQRRVATNLLRMFAPQVAFYGFISVATGVLQARRRFGPPMFAPILNNLTVIAMLLALPHVSRDLSLGAMRQDTAGMLFLGLGTTTGVAAMASLFWPYLRSTASRRLRWHWDPRHAAVRTMIRMSGWTAGFVAANQVALFVTLVLAKRQAGGVTAFLVAYTFFILPHGILSVSVMSAMQPDMAASWATDDRDGFRARTDLGLRLILFLMAPAATGLAILAPQIMEVVLQHGRLSHDSADMTGDVVRWMAIGLPGFSAFIFATRAFQSMQDARTVFVVYAIENLLNIVTAFPFFAAFGVTGLAASQTVAYSVAAIVALWMLHARTSAIGGEPTVTGLLRTTAATAVATVAIVGTKAATSSVGVTGCVTAAILAGASAYLLAAKLLRAEELRLVRRRGPRMPIKAGSEGTST